MKKLTLLLVLAVVCSCVFAGAFTGYAKIGYDTVAHGIALNQIKYAFDDEDFVELEGIDEYAKNAVIKLDGPAATVGGVYQVNDGFTVEADVNYIFPMMINLKGAHLLGGDTLPSEIIEIPNKEGAFVNRLEVGLGRLQLNKWLKVVEEFGLVDISYQLHAAKAHVVGAYTYKLTEIPVDFVAKAGLEVAATFAKIDVKYEETSKTETNATILTAGLTAEADAKINLTTKLAVEFGGLCDCSVYTYAMATQKNPEGPDKLKATAFNFVPTFAGRAAVVYSF